MNIAGLLLDRNYIANQAIGAIIAGVFLSIAGAVLLFTLKGIRILFSRLNFKYRKRLPKLFITVVVYVGKIISLLLSPLARFIYLLFFSLFFTFLLPKPWGFIVSILAGLLSWSFYTEVTRSKSTKEPLFSDAFENLDSWSKITGDPKIDKGFGNPRPSLFLPIVANNPNNSCLELKDLVFTNGIIDADVYLEAGSLLNVIFRGDFQGGFNNSRYYMARFDSRRNCSASFLRNDGNGWNFIARSNKTISPNQWHKMRIVVSGDSFQLYDESGMLLQVTDAVFKKGAVGIFNEEANVFVDNFSIKT